ncbi:MAG: hypothetical protein JWR42_2517 [Marmoricola sp.]|nr:hypothetical protein [Marmoricola sp.]
MDGRDDETSSDVPTRDEHTERDGQEPTAGPPAARSEDEGQRPGDAGDQPVSEDAPGSLGGDNGGA